VIIASDHRSGVIVTSQLRIVSAMYFQRGTVARYS
jgi:hypothetical protein